MMAVRTVSASRTSQRPPAGRGSVAGSALRGSAFLLHNGVAEIALSI